MKIKSKARQILRNLVTAQGLLFIICLINFIVRGIEVDRIDRQMRAYGGSDHWSPGQIMIEPFLLLVAGGLLLCNRWWALLVSLLASARVVYSLGYLPWLSIHYAHDVPMFSSQAMQGLWYAIYQTHPEYPFQVGLGAVVFICASVLLTRVALRKPVLAPVGG